MNQAAIKNSALALKELLDRYAGKDSAVQLLRRAVQPYINSALKSELTAPVAWQDIPGAYLFIEGPLGKYRDLEDAYSTFRIEITGNRDFANSLSEKFDSDS